MDFLARYRGGEREEVWRELVELGRLGDDEAARRAAYEVARETMRRVRGNAEKLVGRLESKGYRFADPALALVDPGPTALEQIALLEKLAGPLPLSVRAFYEIVGGIDLTGRHKDLPEVEEMAPLVVFPIEVALGELDDWARHNEGVPKRKRLAFRLPIGPNTLNSAELTGAAGYGIEQLEGTADAELLDEPHETTFVDYLRISLAWGGLPGLEGAREAPSAFIAELTRDLVAI